MSELSRINTDAKRLFDEIQQMRHSLEQQAEVKHGQRSDFAEMFTQAVNNVNELQRTSAEIKDAYELSDSTVTSAQVMIASQKAKVAFQTLLQVRNKFVSAYKEVMGMTV